MTTRKEEGIFLKQPNIGPKCPERLNSTGITEHTLPTLSELDFSLQLGSGLLQLGSGLC